MKHIRNFCIIAHIDHGKSTLADRLLEYTQTIKVTEGQMLDDMDLEKERGITIKSHAIQMEYTYKGEKYVLNLIDTPGHVDFSAEMERSLQVLDAAILLINAGDGIQSHTKTLWQLLKKHKIPTLIFVNKMDRENADFDSILDNLRGKFGKCVLPLELPLGTAENFEGVIDLYKMKAYRANGNDSDEIEIPEEYKAAAEEAREKMIEAAVEADDDCMMRYLDGETISDEEIMKCLIKGIRQATIFPMICGSAYKDIGLGRLMNAIVDFTYPAILNDFIVMDKETGEETRIPKFRIDRICGTVLGRNKTRHIVTLLTEDGVVNVKFHAGAFSFYDRQLSVVDENGKKRKVESSWFTRGNILMIHGIRREDMFRAKTYKNGLYTHSVYKVTKVYNDGYLTYEEERTQID